MTPKEKAEKLFAKYYNKIEHTLSEEYSKNEEFVVKQCALIAVDEVLNVLPQHEYLEDRDEYCENKERLYWKEVKQEIEKL